MICSSMLVVIIIIVIIIIIVTDSNEHTCSMTSSVAGVVKASSTLFHL